MLALGEGRGIADDKAILPPLISIFPHNIKDIPTVDCDAVGDQVSRSIFQQHGEGLLRYIHSFHRYGAVERSMNGKAACMGTEI